jgi:drug/metabolite transporter (DMT)-like permease
MNNVFYAFFIAMGFVSWAIIGKYVGAGGIWVATIVSTSTLASVFILSASELLSGQVPTLRAISILTTAGLVNGICLYVYTQKTSDISIQTGSFVVIVSMTMVVLAPIISLVLNGEVLTPRQFMGIGCALIAIYLIN